MSSIEEKRVYDDRTGETAVYLASEMGVVRVSVSDDRIGSFGIEHRCTARDLAICGGLAVATDEDILLDGEPAGFGPAVAVGGTDSPIAAGPEGRIARYDGDEWTEIGRTDDIRAADSDLLATGEGVYRVGEGLTHVGLDGVNDVSARGVPLAATDSGLYRLGNGWMRDVAGEFDRVATAGRAGGLSLACAVGEEFYVYEDEWHARDVPETFAAVAVADALYGASADGTLYVDAGDNWRSQALGVSEAAAMVVR